MDFGQDPARFRWKQIKTDDFQIIYPDFFEANAQRMANIYAALYEYANSLSHKPRRVSMIVHPGGGIANGTVAWAPKRSELYTMPPQNANDTWLEHLCVHEFRHVVQIDKVNQGFTKALYYIFGEEATIAVTGLYLPLWFMEGDAVTFETAVGQIGRGRSPEFLNEMKAQVVEKGIYSYDKAALGSVRDFVPNRYTMGYFMVAKSRANYGNAIWSDALTAIGRHPLAITPFSQSLDRALAQRRDSLWATPHFRSLFVDADTMKAANTRSDAKQTLYWDNFTQLQAEWQWEMDEGSRIDTVVTRNRVYTGYMYPTPQPDGSIIAFKRGLRETGAFVRLTDRGEELIVRTGSVTDERFAVGDGRLIWTEYRPHPRWEHGGRNALVSYDMESGMYRVHAHKRNRFSPFRVGDKWGVVEVDSLNRAALVVLASDLEQEMQRIPAAAGELFVHPSSDGRRVVTVVTSPDGVGVEMVDFHSGERQRLVAPVHYELDNPILLRDTLLVFRASFDGNNALYEKNLRTGHTNRILHTPFGVRFPSIAGDSLTFSFYTSDGYKPGRVAKSRVSRQPVEARGFRLADSMVAREGRVLLSGRDSTYLSRRYRKLPHLFNIHSWGPLCVNRADEDVTVGIVAHSQNKLSTLALSGGFIVDSDYDHGAWMFNATYRGLWPQLSVDARTGRDDFYALHYRALNLKTQTYDTVYAKNRSLYSQAEITLQFPFNLSRRNYIRYMTPYVRYKIEAIHHIRANKVYDVTFRHDTAFIHRANKADYRYTIPTNYYQLMEYGLLVGNQTRQTEQEAYPRWAQQVQLGYAHTPWEKMDLGEEWWVAGSLYTPGFAVNHSLSAYGGYQKRPENRVYGKKIMRPRGTHHYGAEMATLRTNYRMPLLFPDWRIGGLAYVKRLDGTLFFDAGSDKLYGLRQNYCSYGIELTAGFHALRLPFPLTMGIQTGYETQSKSMFAEFLFAVQFSI